MDTRVCERVGIEYPIVQAGIGAVGSVVENADLAAAISEAGGLGQIGHPTNLEIDGELTTTMGKSPGELPEDYVDRLVAKTREAIRRAISLTDAPLAINCKVAQTQHDAPAIIQGVLAEREADRAVDRQLKVLFTSGGPPDCHGMNDDVADAGMVHFHAASTVRHAEKIKAEGLDGVVATGAEAGGHIGTESDRVHTFVLVPEVRDAVDLPVLAAGGCTDGQSLAAALSLGADGIYMGTRFVAAEEYGMHRNAKEAVVDAADTDSTTVTGFYGPMRVLENEGARRLKELSGQSLKRAEQAARIEGPEDGDREGGS